MVLGMVFNDWREYPWDLVEEKMVDRWEGKREGSWVGLDDRYRVCLKDIHLFTEFLLN